MFSYKVATTTTTGLARLEQPPSNPTSQTPSQPPPQRLANPQPVPPPQRRLRHHPINLSLHNPTKMPPRNLPLRRKTLPCHLLSHQPARTPLKHIRKRFSIHARARGGLPTRWRNRRAPRAVEEAVEGFGDVDGDGFVVDEQT